MHSLLLAPTDVLFFRDGRPMGGASSGHGAAWPLPTVTNAALHAALWRSGLAASAHDHQRKLARDQRSTARAERFGSLTTAGPFPVCTSGQAHTWFFPRPLDADFAPDSPSVIGNCPSSIQTLAAPTAPLPGSAASNPLPFTVASLVPRTKDTPLPWWSEGAWNTYLGTAQRGHTPEERNLNARPFAKRDTDFADTEHTVGIGIDPATGTQDGERIYSAHYLRLRDGWRLGLFAATAEKYADESRRGQRHDLIADLFTADHHLLVGGQQRLCTADLFPCVPGQRLPLPLGQTSSFAAAKLPSLPDLSPDQPKHLVKWVLLSPAIFPRIEKGTTKEGDPILPHSGGWLPTWVKDDDTRSVLLRAPLPPRDVAVLSRDAYRALVRDQPPIPARLVAALVGKPIPVTGWSLGTPDNADTEARAAGAKPTHLAVPAGSVYYFACDTAEAAAQLAAALNWHGDTAGTAIRNRRSTLLGEKGFGLGVCATWTPHPGSQKS